MTIDDLSKHMRVSSGFVRLCVATGCQLIHEKLSAAQLLVWLFDHYESVRAACGLKPLAPVELPAEVTAQLRMANALVTLLEYSRSRATNLKQKRQLRRALVEVSLLGDRGA